jgi:hypothetical protein
MHACNAMDKNSARMATRLALFEFQNISSKECCISCLRTRWLLLLRAIQDDTTPKASKHNLNTRGRYPFLLGSILTIPELNVDGLTGAGVLALSGSIGRTGTASRGRGMGRCWAIGSPGRTARRVSVEDTIKYK